MVLNCVIVIVLLPARGVTHRNTYKASYGLKNVIIQNLFMKKIQRNVLTFKEYGFTNLTYI